MPIDSTLPPASGLPPVLTVSELNRLVRLSVERSLPVTWIGGEISNLTRAPSGHWYFSLKDANASVRCAMFRNRNQFVDWRPENGMRVEVMAQATIYEARGEYQLGVEAMRRAGLGALYEAFQRLKEKLEREGLFDPARKRPLPESPTMIGVVTSPQAAALGDVLTTLRRRWPGARVIIYPTPVQGRGAAERIAEAISTASARQECDVLLLVRGGGSIEDLWSFNEEVVARAIAACNLPLIAGIGHETDFTIADLVADQRAPTPTGAAHMATPDRLDVLRRIAGLAGALQQLTRYRLNNLAQRLDSLARRVRHPASRLEAQAGHLHHLERRLRLAQNNRLVSLRQTTARHAARLSRAIPQLTRKRELIGELARRLENALRAKLARDIQCIAGLSAQLGQLNPEGVLARGYAIVRTKDGKIVRDQRNVTNGAVLTLTLARGTLEAEVIDRGE